MDVDQVDIRMDVQKILKQIKEPTMYSILWSERKKLFYMFYMYAAQVVPTLKNIKHLSCTGCTVDTADENYEWHLS